MIVAVAVGHELWRAFSFAFGMALVWRYFRRGGGWAMLRMMDDPMGDAHHAHGAHAH